MAVNEIAQWEPETHEVEIAHRTVWAVLVGGLLMWGIHIGGISVLVPVACDRSSTWMWAIHGLTVVTGLAAVAFIGLSWRLWRLGRTADHADRTRLVGLAGLFLNGISLLLILGEEVPAIFMDACAR